MKKFILILLFCLTPSVFGQLLAPNQKPMLGQQINWAHPLSKDLLGYWVMNEGSGNKVFDLTGNGNHGTFQANTAWATGTFGACIESIDQGDYVSLASSITFGNTDTWSVIFKVIVHNTANRDGVIGDSTDLRSVRLAEGALFRFVSADETQDWAAVQSFTTWKTFALVAYGDNTISLYENGKLVSTEDMSPKHTAFTIDNFGRVHSNSVYDLDGQISYVSVYKRALSASEIAQLYKTPFSFMQPSWNYMLYGAIGVPAAVPAQIIMIHLN